MKNGPTTRRIKYEAELVPRFADEIAAVPGNEKLFTCIQCGTCSGTCPLSIYMDYTPRRVIALCRAGFKDEALNCLTIWLCASCYSCTVECPKQIKITDVMYTLKRRAIEEGVYPKRFAIPVLAREFFRGVMGHGRNSEGRVMMRMALKSNPFTHLNKLALGFKLWARGRFMFGRDSVRRPHDLRAYMDAVERRE